MHYPIIPWIGGKRRLSKEILPLFPKHGCYVEAFAGGAALFFMKQPSQVEVLNDANGDLVNLYRVVTHHLEEFVRQFKWALTSRQLFGWLQMTPTAPLTDIQRAARFYYLQKMCFGGKLEGQTFGTATTTPPRLNLLRIEEDLGQAHLRLARAYIEHLDWRQCVKKYDRVHTLFFLDPPYWGTEGYGIDFGLDQYSDMAQILRNMQGNAIVTVNDIPEMRHVFTGFGMKSVPIRYTVGGGGRGRSERAELIIWNW